MPLNDLIRPTVRTIMWGALGGAALPAAFVVWHFHNQPYPDAGSTAFGLRGAALTLALGLAFVLDDPSEDTTAPAPVSMLVRRTLRIALTLPPTLLFWTLLLAYGRGGLPPEVEFPAMPFLVEAVAVAAVALAGAAAGSRVLSDRLGGPAGAGAVALVALAAALLPWGEGLLTRVPGTPPHDGAVQWWSAIAAAAGLVWWRISAAPSPAFPALAVRRPPRARTAPPGDPTPP